MGRLCIAKDVCYARIRNKSPTWRVLPCYREKKKYACPPMIQSAQLPITTSVLSAMSSSTQPKPHPRIRKSSTKKKEAWLAVKREILTHRIWQSHRFPVQSCIKVAMPTGRPASQRNQTYWHQHRRIKSFVTCLRVLS